MWSQFPPSAALPDWGSERPLSVPGVPSLLTPSSFPFTRTPSFRQACPKLRLAGTGKAVTASVSTRPFYPAPPPSRPVRSAHSAFTLLEFAGCCSARPHSRDAPCRLTGTPLGFPSRFSKGLSLVPLATRTWPLFAGGCRPSLASLRGLLSLQVTSVAACPSGLGI